MIKSKYNNERIKYFGFISGIDKLDSLRYFSNLYFHGHSVGGTNPSLLEAMSAKDRQKVEEKIAQIIEEKIEEDARENNQNGAVQKLQASIDDHGIDPSQLSLMDKEQLSKLSDNVLQMIDLPEEIESLYKQKMSEMNNRSDENEGKKQGG